jgi:low affinity Fe/Cu permease
VEEGVEGLAHLPDEVIEDIARHGCRVTVSAGSGGILEARGWYRAEEAAVSDGSSRAESNQSREVNQTPDIFRRLSHQTSLLVGTPYAFAAAAGVIVVWGALGPVARFSDTWQLVINTGTTIVTFLMVFLIQNTQNRDARAMHLKLDELVHANRGARNQLIDVEDLSDEEMERLQKEFERIRGTR